jgi:aspartyl protease family protein
VISPPPKRPSAASPSRGRRQRTGRAGSAAAAWFACLVFVASAQAQSVTLNGQLGNQQALLVIDGQLHTVSVGGTVQGVRLLSLAAGQAEVAVGEKRRVLVLGAGPVRLAEGANSAGASGGSIVMTANGDGHFITQGSINGKAVTFLVDTGATMVSIGQSEADRLGLNYKNGANGFANTANGRIPVRAVTLNVVRVGDVEVANVDAIVMPSQMAQVLLGNSFLSRFQMKRDNDTMRLERR